MTVTDVLAALRFMAGSALVFACAYGVLAMVCGLQVDYRPHSAIIGAVLGGFFAFRYPSLRH